jgi:succinyl-diaminopimelate desuccinylase
MFDEIIDKEKDNIINTVSELIKFPSVSLENDSSKYPFGEECSKVLDYVLKLGESMGFKAKNVDGYCGYLEFGEGEELVGIIGHLDIVPALEEDGWTTPPFLPSIRDGKLFGRGSIDDKGPVVASLYAMKAIKDNSKVSKRVRLILGLNEEKSWKCIDYYKAHEEWPSIGFSPDANFPAIYAEKGIMSVSLKNIFSIKDFEILNIDCKQNAINVVPKYCSITLKNLSTSNKIFLGTDNIKITNLKNNTLKIEAFGIASHAAHPELGKNAIRILVEYLINNFEFDSNFLNKIYEIGLFDITSPRFLDKNKIEDESGVLTSNIAVLDYKENKLEIKINLRVPVTYSLDDMKSRYDLLKNEFKNLEVTILGRQESLYVQKDSYLVKTLVDIFNKKTGLNEKPIAIGGGTYARAFNNFISYGATMPGDKDMCHQVDEFIELDKLILSSKIYAEAIYTLAK